MNSLNNLEKSAKDIVITSSQRAFKMRFKESWISKIGNGYRYDHLIINKPINPEFVLRWENDQLNVYDNAGTKVYEVKAESKTKAKVSQELSGASAKKGSKSDKQSD